MTVRGRDLPLVDLSTPPGPVTALVRPEAVTLASDGAGGSGPLAGTVIAVTFLGATSRVTVDLGDTTIMAQLPHRGRRGAARGQPGHADDPAGPGTGVPLRRTRPRLRARRERPAPAADHPSPAGRRGGAAPGSQRAVPGRRDHRRASRIWCATTSRARPPGPRGPAAARRCCAWCTSPTCSWPTSSHRPGSSSSTATSPTPGTPRSCRCSARRRRSPRTRSTPRCAPSTRLRGPATGAPPELAVTTGDAIDNAQWNEMQAFLALFDGGLVRPGSGAPGYAGVQSLDWPDDVFWKPDGAGPDGADIFRREFGFPHHPGLLQRAMREFSAAGLEHALAVLLRQPRGPQPGRRGGDPGPGRRADRRPEAAAAARRLRPRPRARAVHRAARRPSWPARPARSPPIPAAGRSPGGEFVEAHFRPGARPAGHGFTERNRLDGTAYYVYDTPAARLIALDTSCAAGGAAGCVDRDQARWLTDASPRCTRPTAGRTGARCAPATRTAWSSCSPTTGSTR